MNSSTFQIEEWHKKRHDDGNMLRLGCVYRMHSGPACWHVRIG